MRLVIWVVMFGLIFSFIGVGSAQNIVGVSPGNINFRDVLRGGYSERYLTLTADTDEEVLITGKPRGEIAPWLEFTENFTVSRDKKGRMFLAVRPPSDIPNGNYTGFLRISTSALGEVPSGKAVSAVRAVLDVAVTVEITDLEIESCSARAFDVQSAEKGDEVVFTLNVFNQGNVRLNPLVILEIWDQEQIEIVKTVEFRSEDILPTTEDSVEYEMSTDDMEIGQYWVNVKVPDCYSEGLLTFDVLEEGALKADGILLRIFSFPGVEVGDTVPIIAEFENIGEKDVDAQFKGQLSLDGKIVRVLESEALNVPVNEISNFTFYFTPNKPGSYVASGRVFYDKKRTFESSGVLHVKSREFGIKQLLMTLIYIVLMLAIAVLLYKVHKERRRYLGKIRGVRYGY